MSSPAIEDTTAALDREIQDWIIRISQLLGYPKSVGEIYGLLYVSLEPRSMEEIRASLNMSVGSASQGLRTLRGLRAVKVVYVPGERRDFYEAETYIRTLVGGFLREELAPMLDNNKDRVTHLQQLARSLDDKPLQEHYGNRIAQLKNLNTAARRLIPLLNQFLKN